MEQKSYKLEIVEGLLKQRNHVRGLAKVLKINHMMVSRKMRELLKENVVDYVQEGKNKVYHLKKTEEARVYALMAEDYKLLKLLKGYPHLRKIIQGIQANKKVGLAVLFGSYAKGLAKKDSDIDIYVETAERGIKQSIGLLDSKLSVKIGKYDKTSLLIKELEKDHVIIKGAERYYEASGFFT